MALPSQYRPEDLLQQDFGQKLCPGNHIALFHHCSALYDYDYDQEVSEDLTEQSFGP